LKRAIERHVVYPLANLLATEQVHLGDLVCIDWNKSQDRLTFVREGEGALVVKEAPETGRAAAAGEAKDGKSVNIPTEVVAEEKKPQTATAAPGRKKPERS
jgi:hypothetical protein